MTKKEDDDRMNGEVKQKEFKQEIVSFIEENKLGDVFTTEDVFYNLFKCHLYVYIRVSTEKQEFGRQILEIYSWAKKKNIKICIDCIFCDKYTGKTLKRKAYEEMRIFTKENDYILVSEVSRLGRNWDDVKKEWYKLRAENVNLLIMDYDLLSATLPNEESVIMNVDRKFMQENIFNGILYASCKKIEEVSKSTKAGLKKAKLKGKKVGRGKGNLNTKENFINTLEIMISKKIGYQKAVFITKFPRGSFTPVMNKCYNKYNTKDLEQIIENLKGDEIKWEQF